MQQTVRWPVDDRIVYHGRNGTGKCTGLRLTPTDTYVTLNPFNSRNQIANCAIDVPLDRIQELVEALTAVQYGDRHRALQQRRRPA